MCSRANWESATSSPFSVIQGLFPLELIGFLKSEMYLNYTKIIPSGKYSCSLNFHNPQVGFQFDWKRGRIWVDFASLKHVQGDHIFFVARHVVAAVAVGTVLNCCYVHLPRPAHVGNLREEVNENVNKNVLVISLACDSA